MHFPTTSQLKDFVLQFTVKFAKQYKGGIVLALMCQINLMFHQFWLHRNNSSWVYLKRYFEQISWLETTITVKGI